MEEPTFDEGIAELDDEQLGQIAGGVKKGYTPPPCAKCGTAAYVKVCADGVTWKCTKCHSKFTG